MALAEAMPRPPIIDLTESDHEHPATFTYPQSRDQPPAKRRRVEEHGIHGSLKARLRDQVLPHVDRAVRALSHQKFLVNDIGLEVGGSTVGGSYI